MSFEAARSYRNRSLLFALGLLGACVETTDLDNDKGTSMGSDASVPPATGGGGGTPGGGAGMGGGAGGSSDAGGAAGGADSGGFLGGILAGGGAAGGNPGGAVDSGSAGGGTAGGGTAGGGTAGGGTANFAGKFMGCSSYGNPAGDKCAGYYCKITKAELTPVFPTTGKCSNFTVDRVCGGALTVTVGKCARSEKAAGTVLFLTDAQIRANTEKCVYKDAQFADVAKDCLGCFLDAAQCAGDNCSAQCLTADPGSAACDECRMKNNCNQPVPACAGLPNPF